MVDGNRNLKRIDNFVLIGDLMTMEGLSMVLLFLRRERKQIHSKKSDSVIGAAK